MRADVRSMTAGPVVLLLVMMMAALPATSQTRVSDKDVEALMKNLRDDVKSFRPRFDDGIKKSTIRKTSRAKDAKNLYESFQDQAQEMLENFKRTKKGDDVSTVLETAEQVNDLINEVHLDASAKAAWAEIRTELSQVASALGVSGPTSQAANTGSGAPSCDKEVGMDEARRLVQRCLQVSPATHPPCNVANSCQLITGEIKRGCGMLTGNAPKFCGEYQ